MRRRDAWKEQDFVAVLTTRNNQETIYSLTASVKKLLDFMAKRIIRMKLDGCRIEIVVSDIDGETKQKVRPHAHLLINGKPGSTILALIRIWWYRHVGQLRLCPPFETADGTRIRGIADIDKLRGYFDGQIVKKKQWKARTLGPAGKELWDKLNNIHRIPGNIGQGIGMETSSNRGLIEHTTIKFSNIRLCTTDTGNQDIDSVDVHTHNPVVDIQDHLSDNIAAFEKGEWGAAPNLGETLSLPAGNMYELDTRLDFLHLTQIQESPSIKAFPSVSSNLELSAFEEVPVVTSSSEPPEASDLQPSVNPMETAPTNVTFNNDDTYRHATEDHTCAFDPLFDDLSLEEPDYDAPESCDDIFMWADDEYVGKTAPVYHKEEAPFMEGGTDDLFDGLPSEPCRRVRKLRSRPTNKPTLKKLRNCASRLWLIYRIGTNRDGGRICRPVPLFELYWYPRKPKSMPKYDNMYRPIRYPKPVYKVLLPSAS